MCSAGSPSLPKPPPPPLPDPDEGALSVAANPVSRPTDLQGQLQQAALSTLQIPLRQ